MDLGFVFGRSVEQPLELHWLRSNPQASFALPRHLPPSLTRLPRSVACFSRAYVDDLLIASFLAPLSFLLSGQRSSARTGLPVGVSRGVEDDADQLFRAGFCWLGALAIGERRKGHHH